MRIQARTCRKPRSMRERSTSRSRTTGNLGKGSRTMGLPGWAASNGSTSAEQAGRGRPSISMAQAPHTSSMQLCSHTGGSTRIPSDVTGASRNAIKSDRTLYSCP